MGEQRNATEYFTEKENCGEMYSGRSRFNDNIFLVKK